MQYRIEWLMSAVNELERVRSNLEERGAYEAGQRVAIQIYDSVSRLCDMPRRFPQFYDTDLRRMIVGDYSVFYKIDEQKTLVKIVNIRHHYEDISDLLDMSNC